MRARSTMTAPPAAASSSRRRSSCCKMACWPGQVTARRSGGSGAAGGWADGPGPGYRSSRMPRPCAAMADRVGASWMEAKALTCRFRSRAIAASTPATSTAGTITDTSGSLPMTRAEVTENTNTPTASPNVRHTIGSSRNRFSRGDKLPKAHCTTRNSSEKMTLTSPKTPKPTPISASVTRVLATVGSAVIRGSSRPRPSPATANTSCTRPARSRRLGRPNRPDRRAASRCITTREPFPVATPPGSACSALFPVCRRPAAGAARCEQGERGTGGLGRVQRSCGDGRVDSGGARRSGMTSSPWTCCVRYRSSQPCI